MTHAMCSGQLVRTVQRTPTASVQRRNIDFHPAGDLILSRLAVGRVQPGFVFAVHFSARQSWTPQKQVSNSCGRHLQISIPSLDFRKRAPQENMRHATSHLMCLDFTVPSGGGLTQPGPIFFFFFFNHLFKSQG